MPPWVGRNFDQFETSVCWTWPASVCWTRPADRSQAVPGGLGSYM